MKRLFILGCLLVSSKSVWSQITGSVWDECSTTRPKGRVVMMTTKDYDEIYSFGEVAEVKRRQEETVAYFNKNGNVCYERIINGAKRTEISYSYDGGKLTKRIKTRPKATESGILYDTIGVMTYTYDESGRMKTRSYWKDNTLTSKDRFEYTPDGFTLYSYKGDGTLDQTYKRIGNKLSFRSESMSFECVLDDEDRIIQTSLFLGATNGFGRVTKYKSYNQYGDLMYDCSSVGSSLRNNKQAIVYSRLPNGNIVANLDDQYSNELHTKKGSVFKYEYDANNNWTIQSNVTKKIRNVREIVYAKSNDDFAIVEREIETSRRALDSVLYENQVLALKAAEEAAKAKEAEDRREKQALAAEKRKKQLFTESRRKIIAQKDNKERMGACSLSYPYICKAVRCLRDKKLSLGEELSSFALDCVFHPIDEYAKRLKCYIGLQETLIGSMNDKNQKKDCKTLEHSLKKAGNDTQRVAILETWLKNRGCCLAEILTDKVSGKMDLLNLYRDYDEKLKANKESLIADAGRGYIVWRLGGRFLKSPYGGSSDLDPIDMPMAHLTKCIEVQKFVCRLLENSEQGKELKEILKHIKRKYPKYTNSTTNDTYHTMLFWAFEEYLKKQGIAIPQTYEAVQKAVGTI